MTEWAVSVWRQTRVLVKLDSIVWMSVISSPRKMFTWKEQKEGRKFTNDKWLRTNRQTYWRLHPQVIWEKIMFVYLLLDCGRVQQEGDLLHGLSITADLPWNIVASNYQVVDGRSISIGHTYRGGTLWESDKGHYVNQSAGQNNSAVWTSEITGGAH